MKTFTLDEANALLPVLESMLRGAIENHKKLEELQNELQEVVHRVFLSGGSLLDTVHLRAQKEEREELAQRLRDTLAEFEAIGVQLKDLETGLLDFPSQNGDELILLCWKLGEPTVAYWHTLEAGYKGRKPIDGHISGSKKPN